MKFFISGLGLDVGGGRTVGTNVVRSLPLVDPDNRYRLVFPRGCGYEGLDTEPNCELELVDLNPKFMRRVALDHCFLPGRCRDWKADAALSMSNFGPWKMPCPHLLGVHLPHLLYPDSPALAKLPRKIRAKLALQKAYFTRQARHMDEFCVLSPPLAQRLQRYFGIAPEKIHVIPNAVATEMGAQAAPRPDLENKLSLTSAGFRFCYVAPYYAHKNHDVLIPTMKVLREELEGIDASVLITVDEKNNAGAREFMRKVRDAGLDRAIINTGRLPLDEVPHVYDRSHALFMPTQLECFSNTYVEAMHFGLPILTSDMDFAHAVCGDAAIYFDSEDPHDMARSMKRIMEDSSLRVRMGREGGQRLNRMDVSWKEVTRMYVNALLEAAGEPLQREEREGVLST